MISPDLSNELTTTTFVLGATSFVLLLVVLSTAIVHQRLRDPGERFLISLAVSGMLFVGCITVPFVYNGKRLQSGAELCAHISLTFASHQALTLYEGAFVASVIYTIHTNRFISRRTEIACGLLAVMAFTAMFVFDFMSCQKHPFGFHNIQYHEGIGILTIVAADLVACVGFGISLNLRNRRFSQHSCQLAEHIAQSNSAFAKRQLQLLNNSNRDFNQYVRPLRFYPLVFFIYLVPNVLFVVANKQKSTLFGQIELVLLSPRGVFFTMIYFLDKETRRLLSPNRWVSALRKLIGQRKVRFGGNTFQPTPRPTGSSAQVQYRSILRSRSDRKRRMKWTELYEEGEGAYDEEPDYEPVSWTSTLLSAQSVKEFPEDRVSLLLAESRL